MDEIEERLALVQKHLEDCRTTGVPDFRFSRAALATFMVIPLDQLRVMNHVEAFEIETHAQGFMVEVL